MLIVVLAFGGWDVLRAVQARDQAHRLADQAAVLTVEQRPLPAWLKRSVAVHDGAVTATVRVCAVTASVAVLRRPGREQDQVRRREQGQVTVAGVGIAILLMLAMVVLVHLAAIRSGGARGQSAADIAALAAARVLAGNPDASADAVRTAADRAAAAERGPRRAVPGSRATPGAPTAVDVTVSELVSGSVPGVGQRDDRVRSWSRGGSDVHARRCDQASFRPVDLTGATGATAVVMAAEAQIGWPYVWGGESRAEGGFDCSGLIDYAYGAAGMPLPGRPTAAVLFSMSRRIAESELAPGDLVFLGSPNAYHVGMYVGGGRPWWRRIPARR